MSRLLLVTLRDFVPVVPKPLAIVAALAMFAFMVFTEFDYTLHVLTALAPFLAILAFAAPLTALDVVDGVRWGNPVGPMSTLVTYFCLFASLSALSTVAVWTILTCAGYAPVAVHPVASGALLFLLFTTPSTLVMVGHEYSRRGGWIRTAAGTAYVCVGALGMILAAMDGAAGRFGVHLPVITGTAVVSTLLGGGMFLRRERLPGEEQRAASRERWGPVPVSRPTSAEPACRKSSYVPDVGRGRVLNLARTVWRPIALLPVMVLAGSLLFVGLALPREFKFFLLMGTGLVLSDLSWLGRTWLLATPLPRQELFRMLVGPPVLVMVLFAGVMAAVPGLRGDSADFYQGLHGESVGDRETHTEYRIVDGRRQPAFRSVRRTAYRASGRPGIDFLVLGDFTFSGGSDPKYRVPDVDSVSARFAAFLKGRYGMVVHAEGVRSVVSDGWTITPESSPSVVDSAVAAAMERLHVEYRDDILDAIRLRAWVNAAVAIVMALVLFQLTIRLKRSSLAERWQYLLLFIPFQMAYFVPFIVPDSSVTGGILFVVDMVYEAFQRMPWLMFPATAVAAAALWRSSERAFSRMDLVDFQNGIPVRNRR